jgi:hypothetical protein
LVPTLDDSVELRHSVKLAGDGQCGRCEVHPGAELRFADATSATLESRGNVVVCGHEDDLTVLVGRLRMTPSRRDVVHLLRFLDVDEGAFIGGGIQVLDSDVGLWVAGHGAEAILEGTDVDNPAFLVGASGVITRPDVPKRIAFGVMADAEFSEASFTLGRDQTLLLYTDGATDARNPAGELFGEAALERAVAEADGHSPDAIVASIVRTVERFSAGAPPEDDLTLLAIAYRGVTGSG